LTREKKSVKFEAGMKYKWSDLSENSLAEIKEELGEGNWPRKLASEFEDTSPKVWGNILKGRKASGTYGEVISLINHFGLEEAWSKFKVDSKNRSSRHLVKRNAH